MTPSSNRVFGLDLLRALAIVLVLLFHGDTLLNSNFVHRPNFWIIDGVDLFFVLSGFLIGGILLKTFDKNIVKESDLITFWKRRWFRTLPNYYFILIICLVGTILFTKSMSGFNLDYLVFLQNLYSPHDPFFAIAWSLSIEEWFYFTFPLLVYGMIKLFGSRNIKYYFLIAIGIFFLFPLTYRIYYNNINLRGIVLARIDSIAFGVLGAYIKQYHSNIWNMSPKICIFIGVSILSSTVYFNGNSFWKNTFNYDILSIGILLMFPLLSNLTTCLKWISLPITYVSNISYSLYLIHYSLIMIPLDNLKPYSSNNIAIGVYVLYFILSFISATLVYKYFEKPITNMRDKI